MSAGAVELSDRKVCPTGRTVQSGLPIDLSNRAIRNLPFLFDQSARTNVYDVYVCHQFSCPNCFRCHAENTAENGFAAAAVQLSAALWSGASRRRRAVF